MTLALVLVVLLCAGLLALVLVRRHQRTTLLPGSQLTAEHVRQLIAQGESARLEFKSTMRMNLKRGKAGKEIEIAWLKGVIGMMNTDGGVLLLGVDDAGAILGLNADNFANEDRCQLHFKNLIGRHVGLEHSRFLYFELVDIDQMQVGVIRIKKSPQPAFLKQGQDEEFYIRSGPASVRLTGSKMLKYLRARKA
jgi:predicted HTH transcriptional regulator